MTPEKFEGKRRMATPVPSISVLLGRASRDLQKTSFISQAGALAERAAILQRASFISQTGALAIVTPAATLKSGGTGDVSTLFLSGVIIFANTGT